MIPFLSCDWGTTAFRLSLADPDGFLVLAAKTSQQGILHTYQQWQTKNSTDATERVAFYVDVIRDHITLLEHELATSLAGVPVVISGMASSSVGMQPLPYQHLPFATDGSGALAAFFVADEYFRHDVLLISGVQSADDVMRGEETQLIGCIPDGLKPDDKNIFIFPGTHSKHILLEQGHMTGFKTYMTGEFFDLLSTKSILSAGIIKSQTFGNEENTQHFKQGVLDACGANLLHTAFRARTNNLFELMTPTANYSYLSGLLIGYELQELATTDPNHIYLCCGTSLKALYEIAFDTLGVQPVHALEAATVEQAVIRGQYRIYQKFNKHGV